MCGTQSNNMTSCSTTSSDIMFLKLIMCMHKFWIRHDMYIFVWFLLQKRAWWWTIHNFYLNIIHPWIHHLNVNLTIQNWQHIQNTLNSKVHNQSLHFRLALTSQQCKHLKYFTQIFFLLLATLPPFVWVDKYLYILSTSRVNQCKYIYIII